MYWGVTILIHFHSGSNGRNTSGRRAVMASSRWEANVPLTVIPLRAVYDCPSTLSLLNEDKSTKWKNNTSKEPFGSGLWPGVKSHSTQRTDTVGKATEPALFLQGWVTLPELSSDEQRKKKSSLRDIQ